MPLTQEPVLIIDEQKIGEHWIVRSADGSLEIMNERCHQDDEHTPSEEYISLTDGEVALLKSYLLHH